MTRRNRDRNRGFALVFVLMFSAFLVALFTEMYGFPLTIYLLSGWLQRRYPGLDLLTHDAGHLWETLLGWRGDPHFNPLHLLSSLLIGGGFVLLASAWRVLFAAQQGRRLATTGPYAYVRHPQYDGFILIMLGFLLQWPTLPAAKPRRATSIPFRYTTAPSS